MTTIFIPTPLRRITGGQSKIEVEGANVGELIEAANAQYPGIAEKLLDDSGNIKRFINVFKNDDQVDGLETPVGEGDRVSIVPAMAGGRG